jgi:ribosomal protein S18 acetylase RimI-like enzyme
VDRGRPIGVIICKLDQHRGALRGYIGMLAVSPECRKRGIGKYLWYNDGYAISTSMLTAYCLSIYPSIYRL